MAEFTAGDRVVKMSGIAAGKYGTVNSVREDGTLNVTFDGERMARFCDPERCGKVAANAEKFDNPNYRPADGIKYLDEHFQMFDPKVAKAMIDDAKAKGIKIPMSLIAKAQKAGIAANATFKVGDRAWYKEPSTGEKIEITITGVSGNDYEYVTVDGIKGRTIGYSGKGLYPLNARACNAEIAPELRKAYDEWMKAKAKFDKWWNPDRRLSERPPKDADEAKKGLEFAAVFKKVTGKLTPNGYGSMTLEQMVDAVS